MELAKVTNENLIAGLLLRNRKFNSTDLDVYREILLEKYGYRLSPFAVDVRGIMDYIMKLGNSYYMIDTPDTSKLFMEKQGIEIPTILDSIDIEEVVLRKISKLGSVPEYLVSTLFNSEEEQVINKLLDDMSLIYVWSSEPNNEEGMDLQLTCIGKERLHAIKEEYKEKIMKR